MTQITRLANLRPWKPGQSGNPGGKPNGARNRLQGDFLNVLAEHFAEHGREAIERLCKESPAAYIKAIASLMPRHEENPTDDRLNPEEIRSYIAYLQRIIPNVDDRPGQAIESGVGTAGKGPPDTIP